MTSCSGSPNLRRPSTHGRGGERPVVAQTCRDPETWRGCDPFRIPEAENGWRDLLATQRDAVVEAWKSLTRSPAERSSVNHLMKGELAEVIR